MLYRTCSLEPLRALLPDCRWTYLAAPASAEVLVGNPAIAETLPFIAGDDSWRLAPGAFAELRGRDFDVVLCTNVVRPYPDFALAAALGVPNRVGYAGKGLGAVLTRHARVTVPDSYAGYVRSIVADVGGVAGDWPLRPRVHPGADDRAAAEACRESLGLADGAPVVACALTTRQAAGRHPRAHLVAALREARRARAFELVLLGGAGDADVLHAAAAEIGGRVHVLAGRLGLRAVAAFLERCAALVTLDSGPRHLGNAVGIPVLFVRNLGDARIQTGTYCDTETDLAPADELLPEPAIAAVLAALPAERTARALLATLDRGTAP